jgi:aryl-alcohol dehydrogenase-like predicted oxidoreductase
LPEAIRDALGSLATDAQTGIQFVRSAPGVTTALVGMSNVEHVEENLALVSAATVSPDDLLKVFDQEE